MATSVASTALPKIGRDAFTHRGAAFLHPGPCTDVVSSNAGACAQLALPNLLELRIDAIPR
jgi:hypothetical protein